MNGPCIFQQVQTSSSVTSVTDLLQQALTNSGLPNGGDVPDAAGGTLASQGPSVNTGMSFSGGGIVGEGLGSEMEPRTDGADAAQKTMSSGLSSFTTRTIIRHPLSKKVSFSYCAALSLFIVRD